MYLTVNLCTSLLENKNVHACRITLGTGSKWKWNIVPVNMSVAPLGFQHGETFGT